MNVVAHTPTQHLFHLAKKTFILFKSDKEGTLLQEIKLQCQEMVFGKTNNNNIKPYDLAALMHYPQSYTVNYHIFHICLHTFFHEFKLMAVLFMALILNQTH